MKRVFLIVLDSFGIGELPDAAEFGDAGASTLRSVSRSAKLSIPNMIEMGLGNINGVTEVKSVESPVGAYGKSAELSRGKDTTVGHWEIAGLVSPSPLPTYPDGFPEDVIDKIRAATGRDILCNLPYSGTDVIHDYGREQLETGSLIVYTSADSVLQIAAHEGLIPPDELYGICETVRGIMQGEHGVGRVIARPYVGEYPNYTRTANRRDFSLTPSGTTLLDDVKAAGLDVIAVGKIEDIFAGKGITEAIHTTCNKNGMELTEKIAARDFSGLCFVNLVEFDSHYGHRNDADGYASALSEFDRWLTRFTKMLKNDDILIITADHGCDPGDVSTDHTREYTPVLVCGPKVKPCNIGIRDTFADTAATIAELLGVSYRGKGKSYASLVTDIVDYGDLLAAARKAAEKAYVPYSGFSVGAALLMANGKIYTGCNIENAAYSPTNCAERTAFFKAVSEGERDFTAIAVVGGKKTDLLSGKKLEPCPPCGVCRQVMAEFCGDSFVIVLGSPDDYKTYTLREILPFGFGRKNID